MTNKQQSRGAKRSARVISRVKREVEIGEELSSKVIMHRLYEGDCAEIFIPRSARSLGMMLTKSKEFVAIKGGNRGRYSWRRVE
jgi:hypothetical protein